MRRILLMTIVALCWCMGSQAIEPKGKYISQSGELLFRFVADSLYIDIAQSQRNLSAFKLVKSKQSTEETTAYNAFESYLKNGQVTYREVLIRVTQQKDKEYLLEYFGKDKDRDYNSNERYNIKFVE